VDLKKIKFLHQIIVVLEESSHKMQKAAA